MVIQYCRAAKLDPMQKPVHIVPMSVKDSKSGKYEWRDIVMPGIGLYRIQASRTNRHAGTSEPEFGDLVTQSLGGVTVVYPEWCKVIVKRKGDDGTIYEFTAKEFWIENYAKKDKDSLAPNAMWAKRVFGQLAKCAEAQALRKAFPELGSHLTAEEMEGKIWEQDEILENGKTKEKNNMALLEEKLATKPKSQEPKLIKSDQDIETKIKATTSIDDLMPLMSEVNSTKEFTEKKRLNTLFNDRMKELKGIQKESTEDFAKALD